MNNLLARVIRVSEPDTEYVSPGPHINISHLVVTVNFYDVSERKVVHKERYATDLIVAPIDLTCPQLLTSGIHLSAVDSCSNDGVRSLSPYRRAVNGVDHLYHHPGSQGTRKPGGAPGSARAGVIVAAQIKPRIVSETRPAKLHEDIRTPPTRRRATPLPLSELTFCRPPAARDAIRESVPFRYHLHVLRGRSPRYRDSAVDNGQEPHPAANDGHRKRADPCESGPFRNPRNPLSLTLELMTDMALNHRSRCLGPEQFDAAIRYRPSA